MLVRRSPIPATAQPATLPTGLQNDAPGDRYVAIYDEQGVVKLATTASGVHVLKDTTVQRAVMVVSAAADAEAARTE